MLGQKLDVENLVVRYGGVVAVKGVALTVEPGETVTLLGANGAGKTSTLHGIGGLTTASGRIELGGRDLSKVTAATRASAGLGHVLEGRHVFPHLTVRENLQVARGARRGRTAIEIHDLLPELDELMDRRAGSLSGGQQQMLAIARAVAGAPSVIMLDEPTNGLAPLLVSRTAEIIERLRDLGFALLVVEQRLEVAQRLGGTVHILRHGEIVNTLKGDDPNLPDLLYAAYLS